MRRLATAMLLAAVATAGATVPTTAAAAADTSYALPFSELRDIVVDAAHDHVYLTGATNNVSTNGVVVRSLAGTAVTTVTGQTGADGMALSADGATLYVALAGVHAISAIDTTTLTETARYATGASTCPSAVGEVGTQLWFLYGCANVGDLGVVERSGVTPVVTLDRTSVLIAPGTSDLVVGSGGKLVVNDDAFNTLYVYTLTGDTAAVSAQKQFGNTIKDLTMSPDGTEVIAASNVGAWGHVAYALADLAVVRGYGGLSLPTAVAAAPGFVAVSGDVSPGYPDMAVWTTDSAFVRNYQFDDATVVPGGLALTPDAARLYAVTGNTGPLTLRVLNDPGKGATSFAFTRPTAPRIRTSYTVQGTLTSSNVLPAGQTLQVSRISKYGTVALKNATTGPGGNFSITDAVAKRGTYTYRATFAGDATHAAATGQTSFGVQGLTPNVSIATNAATYAYGARPTVTAHIGTTYNSRTVSIYATPYKSFKRLVKTGTVNSSGNLAATFTVTRRTTFTATFAGDDLYDPRSVTRTVTVGVRLSQAQGGYYSTSGSYRVYHRTVDPVVGAGVTPNRAGTCMVFEAQVYSGGAWRFDVRSDCIALESDSTAVVAFAGTHTAGSSFRIRSTFLGDSYNARTVGGWLYFRFTT